MRRWLRWFVAYMRRRQYIKRQNLDRILYDHIVDSGIGEHAPVDSYIG